MQNLNAVARTVAVSQSGSRACRACATAKAKCVPREGVHAKCERCQRMNKDCISRETVQRKARLVKTTRVAALASKLDDIVTLLAATQQPQHARPPPVISSPEGRGSASAGEALPPPALATPHRDVASTAQELFDLEDFLGSNLEQAVSLFEFFRNNLAAHFPFVVVPAEYTAVDLNRRKPFLFRAIVVAASFRSLSHQTELASKLIQYLTVHLLLQGQQNLDLLQGLLIFIAWYPCRFSNNSALTSMLQLAAGLVFDLGLNRMSNSNARHVAMANAANNGITENPSRSRLHTSEERRALLGCFYLTSVVSTCFKEVDALQYTPYFEECGQALLTRREYQSDIHLVLAGRLQHIVQRIRMSLLYPGSDGIRSFKVPIGVYVKSFSAELEAFKCSIPFELKEDKSLSLQYHHAEIQLYELGLSDPFHGTDNNDYILERLEILYNCLTATKSFIHEYFEVPVTSYHFRTFVIHAQLAHAVIVLSKLTFYDEHPWDTKHVISTLSLMKTLERVSELYEEAEQTTKVNGLPLEADGLFSRWARKVRWLRAWCEPRLPAEAEASAPTTQVPSVLARDDAPLALDDLLAGGLFSDMDELSWQHFMKDWDEGSVNN